MVNTTHSSLRVLILAGGDGRRLGALTIDGDGVSTPKQYCSLSGGDSLLQVTLKRALELVPREHILVVVSEQHRRWWECQLSGLPASNVIVQPCNRGTGIGVLLPLLVLEKHVPNGTVVCLPSDHYIADEEVLVRSLRQAAELPAVDCAKLTLLGIQPSAVDSGLGYMTFDPGSQGDVRQLLHFTEKPDRAHAARLIEQGSVWNSAILVGPLRAALYLYARHAPGLLGRLRPIVQASSLSQIPSPELIAFYEQHTDTDFSRDILQKQPARLQALMVPPCGWNDIGTPARLLTTLRTLKPQMGGSLDASAADSRFLNLSRTMTMT
jgi:mannose-1-phosphate guanylyltransferase